MTHETFRDALARILAREQMSVRELSRRLAYRTGMSADSWRRRLTKYRSHVEPEEETIEQIASAIPVSRSEFPPAAATLHQRVEALERDRADLLEQLSRLREELQVLGRAPQDPLSPSETEA